MGVENLEELIARVGMVLADHPVLFSYLFGSVVRGDARPDSDVDVAIHFEPGLTASDHFTRQLHLGVGLERALARQVDVVGL